MGRPNVGVGVIDVFEGQEACAQLGLVRDVYASVYAEPPYLEGPDDVADFVEGWPRRCAMPGFRLVLAFDHGSVVGMAFGHQLPTGTGWWSGLQVDVLGDVVDEWPGRTFAVIELAVLGSHRRAGLGRKLHDALLAGRSEQRVTLLVRPEVEARPAQVAYQRWGYTKVGPVRPYDGAPMYDSMLRTLPL